jgi:hypothetical protein
MRRDLLSKKAPLLNCAGYTSNNGKHPRSAVSQASYPAASNTADGNAAGQRSGIGMYHFPFAEPYICERGKEPDCDQKFDVPERRWTAEPKNFVNLFCAVIYDLLRRILYAGEDVLARDVAIQRNPTQTSPLAVIMASIVPMKLCICKPEANRKVFTLIDRDIESAVLERQVTDVHHQP